MKETKKLAISVEDWTALDQYAASVTETFGTRLRNAGDRFVGADKIMLRFTGAMADLRRLGDRALFAAAHEAHNELCFAIALLDCKDPVFTKIEYEPRLLGTEQTIDFVCQTEDGLTYYVDAKTIKPKWDDRWDQYEKIQGAGLLTPNTDIVLSKDWMGGVLWHGMFASRASMLKYTREFEHKIAAAKLVREGAVFAMAIGGENSGWTADQLEDFVGVYASGTFRLDDAFGRMEAHDMAKKEIIFDRTISGFMALRRHEFDLVPERVYYNVRPPRG